MTTVAAIQKDPRFNALVSSVHAVWQEIGSDTFACAEECGERVTKESALEGCIDADRLTTIGKDKASDSWVEELCKAGDYDKLIKALKPHFNF